jgi:hypothetical protein
MILIKPDCQVQADNMLRTQATEIGTFDNDTYYVCDGKVWMIAADGAVYRSDDAVETQIIRRMLRTINGDTIRSRVIIDPAMTQIATCHILLDAQGVPKLVPCMDGKPAALYNRLQWFLKSVAEITAEIKDKMEEMDKLRHA